MKKLSFILAAGALILGSCANEDVVNPTPAEGGNDNVPMGFSVYTPNQSRAAAEMETEYYQFAVWAYKGNAFASANAGGQAQTVFDNYLVGYYKNDEANNKVYGYVPALSQALYGTDWYYEGLGTAQNGFTWGADSKFTQVNSALTQQFLKYWDRGYTYTYFYAGAPYGAMTYDQANAEMTFQPITMGSAESFQYMYATARCKNSEYTAPTNGVPNKFVDLTFYRLGAKMRVAIYEDVPGYDVELLDYSPAYTTANADDLQPYTDKGHMYAVPSKDAGHTLGSYAYSATPVIKFTAQVDAPYMLPKVTYTNLATSSNTLNIPLWFKDIYARDNDDNSVPYTMMVTDTEDYADVTVAKAHAIGSGVMNVIPASTTQPNDGFTLNVSFKLIAQDTKEEIIIRGARVNVPAQYCQWLPNYFYTYFFKITTKAPGQPGDPGDPKPDPNKNQYLVPIVFDNVTIENFDDHKTDYGDFNIN